MHMSLARSEFAKALQIVQAAVPGRSTLPILSNLLLSMKKEKVELTATDLEIAIRVEVKGRVDEEGSVTVPARRLGEIVRELPEGEIDVRVTDGNNIEIKGGRSFFKIRGLGAEDYPKLPVLRKEETFTISSHSLREILARTAYAMSRDETRHVLNAIYISVRKGAITAVATDGRRLAKIRKTVNIPSSLERELLLPAKTVREVTRILEEREGEITIGAGEKEIAFRFPGGVLISRLIEGKFPGYEHVVPKGQRGKVTVKREEILPAVRRVDLVTSESSNSLKLAISPGRIILSATTPDVGEAKEEVTATYDGEPMEITFNPQFLLDFLKTERAEQISLAFTDSVTAAIVRSVGDDSHLYVLMPIKL